MPAKVAEQERNEPQGLSAGFKGKVKLGYIGPKAGKGTKGTREGIEGRAIDLGSWTGSSHIFTLPPISC